jgi:hypothetical protein
LKVRRSGSSRGGIGSEAEPENQGAWPYNCCWNSWQAAPAANRCR